METEPLGDVGCSLSAVWCLNLSCVKGAAVPRGLWPLGQEEEEVRGDSQCGGFASRYTQRL